MSSFSGDSVSKSNHRRSLPIVQRLLHASHKSYASIGRRVRPHFVNQSGGGHQPEFISDRALGKHVVALLGPMVVNKSHRGTLRKHVHQKGGGTHKKIRNRMHNETVLRNTCVKKLSRMMK